MAGVKGACAAAGGSKVRERLRAEWRVASHHREARGSAKIDTIRSAFRALTSASWGDDFVGDVVGDADSFQVDQASDGTHEPSQAAWPISHTRSATQTSRSWSSDERGTLYQVPPPTRNIAPRCSSRVRMTAARCPFGPCGLRSPSNMTKAVCVSPP